MKKKKIILIVGIVILIWICIAIAVLGKVFNLFGGDRYKLPNDRFANQQEIEKWVTENIGIDKFQYIDSYTENGKQYWTFKETNERGVEFKVGQSKEYDTLFGRGDYYSCDDNYDAEILKRYIYENELPDGDYFTTDYVGSYSSSRMEFFGRKGKIVVNYTDDSDLKQKATNLYQYLKGFYDYNQKLTGINRELEIGVNFQKEYSEYNRDIYIGNGDSTDYCKLSNFVNRAINDVKKFER